MSPSLSIYAFVCHNQYHITMFMRFYETGIQTDRLTDNKLRRGSQAVMGVFLFYRFTFLLSTSTSTSTF